MPYTWLLFDADGTLFDYDAAEAMALLATMRERGIESTDEHLTSYRAVNAACWMAFERGEMTAKQLRVERYVRWTTAMGIDADPEALGRQYLGHLGRQAILIDGAEDLLARVRATHRIALITNGLADVQRGRLAVSSIAHHFEAIVISDEEGVAKPDAKIFDIAFERMGQPAKSDVLIIGDSLSSDIQGGANYGIDTCWFNPDGETRASNLPLPHHEVRSLSALQEVIARSA